MLPQQLRNDAPFPRQHDSPKRKERNDGIIDRKDAAAAAAKSLQSCPTL